MFSARCVPNMYHFGTFSAQNDEEIAGQFRLAVAAGRLWPTTPCFRRYDAPPRAGWRNVANPQPASRLGGGRTPRNGFRAAKPPKQFHQD